jgi:hypothetical protein
MDQASPESSIPVTLLDTDVLETDLPINRSDDISVSLGNADFSTDYVSQNSPAPCIPKTVRFPTRVSKTKASTPLVCTIVTKFLGRPGRGTGSRVEGRHFIKLWYEGGISLWNDKLLCGTRL